MGTSPTISAHQPHFHLVTPTYNSAATLDEMFRSIYRQSAVTGGDLAQISVIDGASTDETLTLIENWRERFEQRVQSLDISLAFQVISEPDEGIYDAMNKGIAAVLSAADDADLIILLNSDDYLCDHTLQRVAAAASKHPEAGLFYGELEFVTAEGKLTNRHYPVQKHLEPSSFAGGMPLAHPATFVRAGVYRDYGLFNTQYRIAADYDLLYRFIRKGVRAWYIPELLTIMREGGVSTDRAFEVMSYREDIAVRIAAGARPLSEWLRYYHKRLNGRLYRSASHLPGVEKAYAQYKQRPLE